MIRDGYVASFLVTVGPGRFVLVDTGRDPAAAAIDRALAEAGSTRDDVDGVDDGTVLSVGEGTATMFSVPGHTAGSAAWLVGGVLFLGAAADATTKGEVVAAR
ncbi:MAG: hypothetical protein H0V89_14890 [Deltaproteobacteria bacterium]|nr:hypothetical protein [Deltaproteobacteria bacterium]